MAYVNLSKRILSRCIKRWNMKGGGTPRRYAIIDSFCFIYFMLTWFEVRKSSSADYFG